MIGNALENVLEIALRIDVIQLADQGVHRRGKFTAYI
jgi:hypothetical protein